MVAGILPFDGDNPVAVALMHLNNEPADIRTIKPDIPEAVAQIVMKAISKEQNSRYQTAHEMIIDLKNALSMEHSERIDTAGMGDTRKIVLPREEQQQPETAEHSEKKTKKEKTYEQKRDDKFAVVLAVATVILIALIAGGTFLFMHGGSREKTVPDLLDKTIEEAQSIAEENGFKISENITFEQSDTVELGHIIKQDPGANQSVKKDITIVVSNGKTTEEVEVPDVLNMEYKKAADSLTKQGFDYKIEEQESTSVQENYVIRQSPSAGTKAAKGSVVVLYVSKATESENCIVPQLVGQTEEKAQQLLEQNNLKISVTQQYSTDVEAGKVISQSPSSRSEAAKNSTVHVVVSKGAESTPEPTQTPKAATPEPTQKASVKTLSLSLPQDRESVHVKVVANDKTIYDETHDTSKGVVNIPVSSSKDAEVKVYFDGELVSEKTIEFN
jgi:serine/threonine-protein kinase